MSHVAKPRPAVNGHKQNSFDKDAAPLRGDAPKKESFGARRGKWLDQVFLDPTRTGDYFTVTYTITRCLNSKAEELSCFPGDIYLADLARVSTKTVQRALKWAAERGHINLGPWSQHTPRKITLVIQSGQIVQSESGQIVQSETPQTGLQSGLQSGQSFRGSLVESKVLAPNSRNFHNSQEKEEARAPATPGALQGSVSGLPKVDVGRKRVASGATTEIGVSAGKATVVGRGIESSGATDSSPPSGGESESGFESGNGRTNLCAAPPVPAAALPVPADAELARLQDALARAEEGGELIAIAAAEKDLKRHIESAAREAQDREDREALCRFAAKLASGEIAVSDPVVAKNIATAIRRAEGLGDRNLLKQFREVNEEIEKAALFARGAELKIPKSVIGRLLKSLQGNIYQARLKVELASKKDNPTAYINFIAASEAKSPSKEWSKQPRRAKTFAEQVII